MRPHPRNLAFDWPDRSGPFYVISEAQADSWNTNGFFLLEDAIAKETLAELTRIIDPLEAAAEDYVREKHDGVMGINRADEITFTVHLVKRDATLKSFATSELFSNLCLDLIGDTARLYWDQAVYKKPETPKEFPWHQDNGYTYIEPQDYLTCWIPLNDATIENGCPWVVPGVHRSGTLDHWLTELGFECLDEADREAAIPVPAKAGDIVVFSSLTPHRTGPNVTDGVRKAYILQYSHDNAQLYPRDSDKVLFQFDEERQPLVAVDGQPV